MLSEAIVLKVEEKSVAAEPIVDKPPISPTRKKPYRAPTLVCWGTLRDITQAVGRSGAKDHAPPGHGNANKTRL
jgi:hypothetical protein